MIQKFKKLKNLAVFRDFQWDSSVRDKGNNIILFGKLNIFYGRNYSGKTTLSRVLRALETGFISDKYMNPECCICISDETDVTQEDFSAHDKEIRVFNEDFVKENLQFIIDSDKSGNPFAILGESNNELEEEIDNLKSNLGSNEEGEESGLYQELHLLKIDYDVVKTLLSNKKSAIDKKLKNKAISRNSGIKYQSEKYGDQNYTTIKLKNEINHVQRHTYQPISDKEKLGLENLLNETVKEELQQVPTPDLIVDELIEKTKNLVTEKISASDKIDSLLKNAILNKWVKEGRGLHKAGDNCSFCNNRISEDRWGELENHFDEESEKLELAIDELIEEIKYHKAQIERLNIFDRKEIYAIYHQSFDNIKVEFKAQKKSYLKSLEDLRNQLTKRKIAILNDLNYVEVSDNSVDFGDFINRVEKLKDSSNEYSNNLNEKKEDARIKLRYKEVYDFKNDILYEDLIQEIDSLDNEVNEKKIKIDNKENEITVLINTISDKQKQLKDESKGAEKVNEYLNHHFGHNFLSLESIELEDEDTGNNCYRFEIHRDGRKAHHLSDGEKSLIAFCYFIAKLEDVDTKGKNPIIWIDDPISSLDSNHIFFIFSLINKKICASNDYSQLFISTHNLNFLKYLFKLPPPKRETRKFLIERTDKDSFIYEMPNYLQKNVTEFNHLFKQIYECAQIDHITDETYQTFYNFGNNARKFFEIYLYYKYPDSSMSNDVKLQHFFGDDVIPPVLVARINNEYSHLSGVFERGEQPVEVPEMNSAANLIIQKLKEIDAAQYSALLNSIGISESEEE